MPMAYHSRTVLKHYGVNECKKHECRRADHQIKPGTWRNEMAIVDKFWHSTFLNGLASRETPLLYDLRTEGPPRALYA